MYSSAKNCTLKPVWYECVIAITITANCQLWIFSQLLPAATLVYKSETNQKSSYFLISVAWENRLAVSVGHQGGSLGNEPFQPMCGTKQGPKLLEEAHIISWQTGIQSVAELSITLSKISNQLCWGGVSATLTERFCNHLVPTNYCIVRWAWTFGPTRTLRCFSSLQPFSFLVFQT